MDLLPALLPEASGDCADLRRRFRCLTELLLELLPGASGDSDLTPCIVAQLALEPNLHRTVAAPPVA